MKQDNLKKQRGFSLLEMLMILIIFGLLGALFGPRLFDTQGKARQKGTRIQIERFMGAMAAFRLDMGRYPSEQEGLAALVTNPRIGSAIEKWRGPYLKKAVPNDPWDNPYRYRSPGEHGEVDIYSYGKDNQPGGEKENSDLVSWE